MTNESYLDTQMKDPAFKKAFLREEFVEDFLESIHWLLHTRKISRKTFASMLEDYSVVDVEAIFNRSQDLTIDDVANFARVLNLKPEIKLSAQKQ